MSERESIAVKSARAYSVSLPQMEPTATQISRESFSGSASLASRKRTKVMLKLYKNYLLHVSLVAGINLHRIVTDEADVPTGFNPIVNWPLEAEFKKIKVKKGFIFILTNQLTAYKLWADRVAKKDKETNNKIQFIGHTADVNDFCFGLDEYGGLLIFTAANDKSVKMWEMKSLNTVECTKVFYIPSNPVIVRVIGDKLITVSQDNTMSVWERESGNWLYDLTGHRDTVVGVEVSAWSTYKSFITYSKDGTVRLWNIEDRKSKVLLKDLAIEDGCKIRTTCDKGRWKSVCLFNQRNGLALIYYKSKKNSIRKDRVSTFCRYKNEHFLISSARDRSIVYRESETKEFNSLEVADPNPCEAVCVFVKKHSKCLLLSLYNEKTPILIRFPSVKKSSSAVNSPADKRESTRSSSRQSTITN